MDKDYKGPILGHGPEAQANFAIAGMPKTELSDRLADLEASFQKWRGVDLDSQGLPVRTRWFHKLRRLQLGVAGGGVKILRLEIAELAVACAKSMNDERAGAVHAASSADYSRLVGELRELRQFVGEQFPDDIREGEAADIPLTKLVRQIMLRLKTAS